MEFDGPCGWNLQSAMLQRYDTGATFDQRAWELAKQEACLPCPGRFAPRWPSSSRWVRPMTPGVPQVIVGAGPLFYFDPPFVPC